MQTRYLTTEDAADYLGLSASYLAKLRMCDSTIRGPKYLKIGLRAVRYSVVALDDWMDARSVDQTSVGRRRRG